MAQKIGHLTGREGFDAAVWLLYSIDQCGGEGVAEGVKAFPIQSRRLQDAVIPFAEVHRAGVVALLIGDQGAVLPEVPFRSQGEDGVHGRWVQRNIPLAGGGFQLSHLHFLNLHNIYLFFR